MQGGQVTSHHVGANKPDLLAPKFGFSGVGDSDFRVPTIRIFVRPRFGFSEPAGQGALINKKAGSTDNGTPRPLKRARIAHATVRTSIQALPQLNLILRSTAPYFQRLPSCLLASS